MLVTLFALFPIRIRNLTLKWKAIANTGNCHNCSGYLRLLCLLIDRIFSGPSYHGPITDDFDRNRFHNAEPPERKRFLDCYGGNQPESAADGSMDGFWIWLPAFQANKRIEL